MSEAEIVQKIRIFVVLTESCISVEHWIRLDHVGGVERQSLPVGTRALKSHVPRVMAHFFYLSESKEFLKASSSPFTVFKENVSEYHFIYIKLFKH